MRVLVTGGTGFLGSQITTALRRAGHDVRLLVRTPSKVDDLYPRLDVDPADLDVVVGDVTDAASVRSAVQGCDAAVHAAAVVGVDPTTEAAMEATNVAGATNVLGAATDAGCDPVVHVSSSAALFPFRGAVVSPDDPPAGGGTTYGRTKAACDRLARGLQDDGAPVVILYPSMIVGPGDWTGSTAIGPAVTWVTRPFGLTEGISNNYVDVRDLAAAVVAATVPGRGPRRYLAFGHHLTLHEQRDVMERVLGRPLRTVPMPRPLWWTWGRLGDVARRFGRDLVLTSDGYDYLFNTRPGDDSRTTAELGVRFRPVEETFADWYRWLHEAGHVPADVLGTLVES